MVNLHVKFEEYSGGVVNLPTAIEINPGWVERVASLVERYNNYARRHSMTNCADMLDQLVKLLEHGGGVVRIQAAEALFSMRNFNPELFTYQTGSKIDNILIEAQADGNLTSNTVAETNNVSGEIDYSDEDDEVEYYSEPSYDEDDNDQNEIEVLMTLPIEDLKLANITIVEMKEEWNKRKCALGDGELKDYDGPLCECTCGTLYHEACLKIQAVYVGTCHICDRKFR